jgi:hypothetical protein
MERIIPCQNSACRKSFKVSTPGRIADYVDVLDVQTIAFLPLLRSP